MIEFINTWKDYKVFYFIPTIIFTGISSNRDRKRIMISFLAWSFGYTFFNKRKQIIEGCSSCSVCKRNITEEIHWLYVDDTLYCENCLPYGFTVKYGIEEVELCEDQERGENDK